MSLKITDLTSYSSPANADVLAIVDVGSGITKKIQASALINAFIPTGSIQLYGAALAPTNWLLCDGTAVSRSTYSALFAVLGTTYGVGDGSTTFNVPDLRGRVAVGKSSDSEFLSMGLTGGAKTVTLTTAQIPSHTHTGTTSTDGNHRHQIVINNHSEGTGGNAFGFEDMNPGIIGPVSGNSEYAGSHNHTFTTAAAGSGGSHNNLQPYITLTYIIKT